MVQVQVASPLVKESESCYETKYAYRSTLVSTEGAAYKVTPVEKDVWIKTDKRVPRVGLMLVGWGGNNGSTLTAALAASKHSLTWETKDGLQEANFLGSITQASTLRLGSDIDGNEIYAPIKDVVPLLDPKEILVDGWDISSFNLAQSMKRAKVIDINLQSQLWQRMEKMRPRASVFYPDFIAANQGDRADNVLSGSKSDHLQAIRADIRDFKQKNTLEKVIVFWTANTERFSDVRVGLNTTADEILSSVKSNASEISPSTIFAIASILENCSFINGSPQNTFVPGVIELAERENVFIIGDDLKTGQTKFKSVLVDFLISAGIKPKSIVSYNHLGNNDGFNLSAPQQFKSKEVTKTNVVDDMIDSNPLLYKNGEIPDHSIVIKYIPFVGDSKRAMDEYSSELMLGGLSTIAVHNVCEDSLLAAPLILDMFILTEFFERVFFKVDEKSDYQKFDIVLSVLSYFCKAPLSYNGKPVVNALFRQKACLENVFRACVGLPPENYMLLEHKVDCINSKFLKLRDLGNNNTYTPSHKMSSGPQASLPHFNGVISNGFH